MLGRQVKRCMPFFHDIDPDDEALSRPIWGTFALLKDNLERLLAVNIGWSLQILPAVAALAFPGLPLPLRVVLFLYSTTALAPASALLFVWTARVYLREPLRLESLKEDFLALALRSLLCLAPLFSCLGLCLVCITLLSLTPLVFLSVLARLALLILLVCALYWGPLFAEYPERSPLSLLWQSLLLVWRYPAPTALTGLAVLLVTALGMLSVAGFFLIVPVLVALLQTGRCAELLVRERGRLRKFKVGAL